MPFEGERAGPRALLRVLNNPRIRAALERMNPVEAPVAGGDLPREAQAWPIISVKKEDVSEIAYAVAFDGSLAQEAVVNGFPGAEAAIVTMAMVLIDLEALRTLAAQRPVDPVSYRRTSQVGSADCAFPGFNVTTPGALDARHAFRRAVRDYLAAETVMEDSAEHAESLLATYRALLRRRAPGKKRIRCPYADGCDEQPPAEFAVGEIDVCPCLARREVFDIDALRLAESFRTEGPTFQPFGELMQVTERLALVNTLRRLVRPPAEAAIPVLTAFFVDGPLAVHGHPAWLSQSIRQELRELNQRGREEGAPDLMIIGIEKSGAFVEFLRRITAEMPDGGSLLRPGQALLLNNDFIRRHIHPGDKPYGQDTYFGRKFFYVNGAGAPLVVNVATFTDEQDDLSKSDVDCFPRVGAVCALLDETFSSRYEGGVGPLIAAHAEASIPLRLGHRVLGDLIRGRVRRA